MFYCEDCANKQKLEKNFVKSVGKCEICGKETECYDCKSYKEVETKMGKNMSKEVTRVRAEEMMENKNKYPEADRPLGAEVQQPSQAEMKGTTKEVSATISNAISGKDEPLVDVRTTIQGLLNDFCENETPVFVNGLGIGRVIEVKGEYVGFEITREEEKTKKKKNKETKKMEDYKEKTMFKEVTYIPIAKIETLSEGEKEVPKSEDETKIDDDLGDL